MDLPIPRGNDTDTDGLGSFILENYTHRIIIAFFMCVVFVVGSVGNSLVILAVMLSRKLRSSTNWFIVNLACADLLTSLALPFGIVAMLSTNGWPLPGWICAVASAVFYICLGASGITLALIAYNRWYLLTRPMSDYQKLYTGRHICVMVTAAWLYPSLLTLIPHFAGLGRLSYSKKYKACGQDKTVPTSNYYSLIAGAGVILPIFIALVVIYVRIYRFVWKQSKKMTSVVESSKSGSHGKRYVSSEKQSSGGTSQETRSLTAEMSEESPAALCSGEIPLSTGSQRRDGVTGPEKVCNKVQSSNEEKRTATTRANSRRRKSSRIAQRHITVTRRLSIIVLAFFICILPFGVNVLVPLSDPGIPWTSLMLTFNSCVNPVIYARTMPVFRKVMACIITCRLSKIPERIDFMRRFK